MNIRKNIFLGVLSFLSLRGVMFSNFGSFYIQLQTASSQVVNLLIDDLSLDFINGGLIPIYANGEFVTFHNATTCTVTFPTTTSVQLKFTNPSQFGPNNPGPIHMHTYPLMGANNQLINSSEITRVSVGLPAAGIQPGTMAGNVFSVTETYPLFRYF